MNRTGRIKRAVLWSLLVITLFIVTLVGVLYWKQDSLVQELISTLNNDFKGSIEISDSHISPFVNFPYISIDLDDVRVYETKARSGEPIVSLKDVYLGFDILNVLRGSFEVRSLKLSDGSIRQVQHKDGTFNITNALSTQKEIDDVEEEFHLDIQSIQLVNVDLLKHNEANDLIIEAFIDLAKAKFRSQPDHLYVGLDSRFTLNVLKGTDTTFIHHKHFDVHTELDYVKNVHQLIVRPSEVRLENASFEMDGRVDFDDDMNLDIRFKGSKPNFDLFMAFAPPELMPALQRYDNGGKIFFEASVTGKSINGHLPLVVANFGCEQAFFNNKVSQKKLDDLYFKGYFTSGELRNTSTMEFSLTDFSARPEAGVFKGSLLVKNFDSPEIDMKLNSKFELDFLAKFLNISDLQDLSGSVELTMNFHDIIDLQNPEKSIEQLNESYFTELEVKNLSFKSPAFHLPFRNINIKASMDGHRATINYLNMQVGNSDIHMEADISDLPAILHHTADPVEATLRITSSTIDVHELTSGDTLKQKPVDEQLRDLRLRFHFNSSARSFTESPNLPVGEFFIDSLSVKLVHYPHTLHDFHADVFIDDQNFRIIDFTGMIDESDFHFTGKLNNYDLWFDRKPRGDTKVEFNLKSSLVKLDDLFSYGGENYVPEDYRHEEFRNLFLHGFADLHFNDGLKSSDVTVDKLEATMKIHPLRFEKFNGKFHFEDEHLQVQNLSGRLGKSEFTASLNYYVGTDEAVKKRDNSFSLRAPHLDFDELFNYTPPPRSEPVDHDAVFNIYDLPFTDMKFEFDIKHLNYHRYLINNFHARARTQQNHYIYIDTLSLEAAGGTIGLKGYFNGSDRNNIYLHPTMRFRQVDLDKLLLKFENFGQDHLVSENLHGKLNGTLSGKVHVHTDLVPIIDDSALEIDFEVTNGRLERYAALDALADYFKDKNLTKVLFDTLSNTLTLENGKLKVPKMTINSSLGFIEVSGEQNMNLEMEYFVRIPLKLVTQVGMQKLFGKKEEIDPDQEDAIQYRDESKNIRFINLKITGTPDNYKVSIGKAKK